jgi:hypothetical protein
MDLSSIDKMTTRQHLIEQDCMSKLNWSVERVAYAKEDEMIGALLQWENNRSIKTMSPVSVEQRGSITEKEILPEHSITIPPIVTALSFTAQREQSGGTYVEQSVESHVLTIQKLRTIKNMKEEYITLSDAIPEDRKLFLDSMQKDQQKLEQSITFVTATLEIARNDVQKKQQVRTLLRQVMNMNGGGGGNQDILHMDRVESQLVLLENRVKELEVILSA